MCVRICWAACEEFLREAGAGADGRLTPEQFRASALAAERVRGRKSGERPSPTPLTYHDQEQARDTMTGAQLTIISPPNPTTQSLSVT